MTGEHPRFAGIGGHHSARSKTDEWLTPPEIINALGGADSFDLDPCSPAERPYATAREHWTAHDNSLGRPWEGRVWLNPPYSQPLLSRFLGRMAEHGRGIALIFARTETDAFCRLVWPYASGILFVQGRLNFHLPDGTRADANSGAPSVLVAYGTADADALRTCPVRGKYLPIQRCPDAD